MSTQNEPGPTDLRWALSKLTPQQLSTLAVLALAWIWQARFPEGWVSAHDFARYAAHIGTRDDDSLRRTLRRAVAEIESKMAPAVSLKSQRRPGARDDERRLQTLPYAIESWLLEEGGFYLFPDIWHEFCATAYAPTRTPQETILGLEEISIAALTSQGRLPEAIDRAERALQLAATPRERMPISLALADALFRAGGDESWTRAESVLQQLVSNPPRSVDLFDRILLGRLKLQLALIKHLWLERSDLNDEESIGLLEEIEDLVRSAQGVTTALSLADRCLLFNVEAMVLKSRAKLQLTPEIRDGIYREAEDRLLRALPLARAAQAMNAITATLGNLGNLWFSWAEIGYGLYPEPDSAALDPGPAGEEWALERGLKHEAALEKSYGWYQLCIYYLESVQYRPGSALCHILAAQCMSSLVEWSGRTGQHEEATRYRDDAATTVELALM